MVGLYLAQQLSDSLRSFLIGWSLSSETAERFSKTLDETAATLQKVKFTNINFTLVTIIFLNFYYKFFPSQFRPNLSGFVVVFVDLKSSAQKNS